MPVIHGVCARYQDVALGDRVAVNQVFEVAVHVDPVQKEVYELVLMRTFTVATPLGKFPGATKASVEVPWTKPV